MLNESISVGPSARAEQSALPRPVSKGPREGLRLSYFVAWFIVLLLLLIIGGLSMSAISTGAQLALRDAQAKRLAKEVQREASY